MTSQLEDLMAAINKKYFTEKRKYLSEIGQLKRNLDAKELKLTSKGEEILRLRQENDGLQRKMAQFQRRCSNDFLDNFLVKSNPASPRRSLCPKNSGNFFNNEIAEHSTLTGISTSIDSYCQTENFDDIIEKELQLRLEAFIRLYANEKSDPRNLRLESDGGDPEEFSSAEEYASTEDLVSQECSPTKSNFERNDKQLKDFLISTPKREMPRDEFSLPRLSLGSCKELT